MNKHLFKFMNITHYYIGISKMYALFLYHCKIRFKDTRVMLSLFKILVRPHVEYCSSAWNPYYKR